MLTTRDSKQRKIVFFVANDQQAIAEIMRAMHGNGDLVNLVLSESKEVGGIGFLVFEEK